MAAAEPLDVDTSPDVSEFPRAIARARRAAELERRNIAAWEEHAAELEAEAASCVEPHTARRRDGALRRARLLRERAEGAREAVRGTRVEERIASYIVECAVLQEKRSSGARVGPRMAAPSMSHSGGVAPEVPGVQSDSELRREAERAELSAVVQNMLEEFRMVGCTDTIELSRRCKKCLVFRKNISTMSALYCTNCGHLEIVADESGGTTMKRRDERKPSKDEITSHMIHDMKAMQFHESKRLSPELMSDITLACLQRGLVDEEMMEEWASAFPHLAAEEGVRTLTLPLLNRALRDIKKLPRRTPEELADEMVERELAAERRASGAARGAGGAVKRGRSGGTPPAKRARNSEAQLTKMSDYYCYEVQMMARMCAGFTPATLSLLCELKFMTFFNVLKTLYGRYKGTRTNYITYTQQHKENTLRFVHTETLGPGERAMFKATLPQILFFEEEYDSGLLNILHKMEEGIGMDASAPGIVVRDDVENPPPLPLAANLGAMLPLEGRVEEIGPRRR